MRPPNKRRQPTGMSIFPISTGIHTRPQRYCTGYWGRPEKGHLPALVHMTNTIGQLPEGGHELGVPGREHLGRNLRASANAGITANLNAREEHARFLIDHLKHLGLHEQEIHHMPVEDQYYGHGSGLVQ